ncbi:MAG: carboxypeptidase regulatory-like domain-containing protein [Bryobacteraceae bacterium]
MKLTSVKCVFASLATLVLLCGLLLGQQNTATIMGNVTDPSGAAITGAKVTVTDELTGLKRIVTSGNDGAFLFPLLRIGTYRVSVEATGFKSFVQAGIQLQLNQNARIDAQMQLGSISDTIEVAASVPLVDTYSAAGGDVVETKRITELPLNGRNALSLATLLPGVTVATVRTALTGGDRSANSFSVNGSRTNETDYQMDGMRFAGSYNNSGLEYPSPDSLQEFKLITNAYGAEYGFYAGSVFTAVTRSGTNQLHGALWEFFRNDKLNARNFFAKTVPVLRQNQFGASAGFPFLRNKLFGYVSYQGLRIRGTSSTTSYPLTADQRAGIFTKSFTDPDSGLPFANNTIPASRINPVAAKLLNDYIPVAPSTSSGLLATSGSNPTDVNHWIGKFDFMPSSSDSISVSYFFDKTVFDTPFAGGPYPAYGARSEDQIVPLLSINETHTFSPTLLNLFRGGLSGQEETRRCVNKTTPRDLGINIDLEGEAQPPNIGLSGLFSIGNAGQCQWIEGGLNWQVADTLTWIRGRHNLKVGMDVYRREFHLITAYFDPASFSFNGYASGNVAADFLLGKTSSVSRRPLLDMGMRSWDSAFFFQDDFRVSRRLTLNLGLRYELLGPFDEYRGEERSTVGISQNATFRYGMQSKIFPTAPTGLLFTGDVTPDFPDGLPSTMVKLDKRQIQPRIGFAYDVFGDGKTSIRGSYGLYSNAHFGDMGAQSYQNQPFVLGQTLSTPAGGLSDPWYGLENPFPRVLDLTSNPNKKMFFTPAEAFGWDPGYSSPRVQGISFGVQREVFSHLAIDAGYAGKLSRHLEDTINVNQADYIPGVDANGKALSTTSNVDSRRHLVPNIYQKINIIESIGNAAYHSFQSTVKYRGSDLFLMGAYTWSKSLDTGQNTNVQGVPHQNSFDPDGDRGYSEFDRRHVVRISWVYTLPRFKFNAVTTKILGGWEFSGITYITSGSPYTVRTGQDRSLSGVGNDRPNLVGDPNLSNDRSRAEKIAAYFNTAAFVANTTGQFGNVGRNTLIGPGSWGTDTALMRTFGFLERFKMQFRAEFFSVFNNVNLGNPSSTLTSTTSFGKISSASGSRVVQFGLKLNY